MLLRIFGSDSPRNKELTELTNQAAIELGLDYTLVNITDSETIAMSGIIMTPALAVDNVVVAMGQVPSLERIKELLTADYSSFEQSSCSGDCSG